MLPLVLLLAASDPSPSLAAIVALGKGAPAAQEHAAASPHDSAAAPPSPSTSTTATAAHPATTPTTLPTTLPTKAAEPTPWAGGLALAFLAAGAAAIVWKKRKTAATTKLLTLRDAVMIGRGRSLVVADVGGRRVLLSSSEAGIALLLDLGTAPTEHTAAEAAAIAASADADATDFARALAEEVRLPTAATASLSVDVEGQEIQRRLEKAREARAA